MVACGRLNKNGSLNSTNDSRDGAEEIIIKDLFGM